MELTYEITVTLKWVKDQSIPSGDKLIRHFLMDEESEKIFAILWKRKDLGLIYEPWRVHLFFSDDETPCVGHVNAKDDGKPASFEDATEMAEEAVQKAWRAKEPKRELMFD